jgi:hypothetical protein
MTGQKKRQLLRTIFHLIALSILVYSFINPHNKIDLNSCYYLFSTIGQSLAAIFALMGTFLVFRINLIDNKLDKMESHLIDVLKIATNSIYSPLAFKNLNFETDIVPKLKDRTSTNMNAVNELFKAYKTIINLRKEQIHKSIFSFIYIISTIILSFIFVYLTPKFDINNEYGTVILRLILSLAIWAFIECCIFIWLIIKENPFSN